MPNSQLLKLNWGYRSMVVHEAIIENKMKLDEAKEKFVQEWGTLGSKWGINRTMAQVHALLLASPEALSADEVMEQLNISRGNANMNLRALIDWRLIKKVHKSGERREFFFAEKDIWKVARQVMKERKRRELEPMRAILSEMGQTLEMDSPEAEEFQKIITDLEEFTDLADRALELMIKSEKAWMFNNLLKLLAKKDG